jgi:DNA-binding LacI/PurR family transcriptional regulator
MADGGKRSGPAAPTNGADGATHRAATIYDVAHAAGVSHQTVSRYLRGYAGIRPATRDRVMQALDELGYRPNQTARTLKSGRSQRIGALTHEISLVGPSRMVEGASAASREAGYVLDIVSLDSRDPRAIERSLDLIIQHDLAGVLAFAVTDEMTRAFHSAPFRVPAYLAVETDGAFDDSRGVLARVGVPLLIDHLAGLGHRRFVHVAGPSMWSAARNRTLAYTSAVAAAGLHSAGILTGDWSAASGYAAVAGLAVLPDATAFLAANDQMALGVMLALKERGLRIPADASVVGIDDIAEAAYFDPPLTTVRNDFETQGRRAVVTLLARLGHGRIPIDPVRPPELVIRRSSGPVPSR